jgi:hypothetical protein
MTTATIIVVVCHRLWLWSLVVCCYHFFSCSMVAMSLTRRGPASGMKKKGGGDVCYCSPVMRIRQRHALSPSG